jgi:hypothetical protein
LRTNHTNYKWESIPVTARRECVQRPGRPVPPTTKRIDCSARPVVLSKYEVKVCGSSRIQTVNQRILSSNHHSQKSTRRPSDLLAMPPQRKVQAPQVDTCPFLLFAYLADSPPESLKRAFETAHRAHFQSDQRAPHSSVPLPEPGGNSVRPPSSTTIRAPSISRDTDATGMLATNFPTGLTGERTASNPILEEPEPTGKANWIPEGTLRHDYVQHEPNQLFPDPSSTVPNATLTQQYIWDPAAYVSNELENGIGKSHIPPEPSLPWSDYLRTSPTDDNNEQPSSEQQSHTPEPASVDCPLPELPTTQTFLIPQLSQQSLSLVGDAHAMENTPIKNQTPRMDINLNGVVVHSQDASPKEALNQSVAASSKSRKNSQTLRSTPSHRSRKTQQDLTPYSDDDLGDIGVPKEQ